MSQTVLFSLEIESVHMYLLSHFHLPDIHTCVQEYHRRKPARVRAKPIQLIQLLFLYNYSLFGYQ